MASKHSVDASTTIPEPRLIPHVVSEKAKNAPQSIWASIPISSTDPSAGYEDITFARLNYSVSRATQWLQRNVCSSKQQPQALAYMGAPDTRYIIFTIAAMKSGSQMLFLSPRNSDEAQLSVVEQADCQTFLYSSSMSTRVEKLLQSHRRLSKMTRIVVPEQEDLLKDEFVPEILYDRTVDQARSEPLVILHTSSTTGIPKIIPLTQGYGMHEDVVNHIPKFDGLDIITRSPFYGPCRMFVAMPLYHGGGVLLTLLKSLYQDIVSVFQPSAVALSPDVFDGILRHGKCTGCVIPPYLLEEMLTDPQQFDTLAALDFVQFGSGPLSKQAGDQLLTRQKKCPHYIGSTECGLFILLELDDPVADWQYFRFHPWSGADMRPIDDTGQLFELFIVRSEASKVPGIQPVFELFPDLKEFPTKDLYVRHPDKPDHWRCIGRNDDVLVLSNGEKLNPVDTEGRIANTHPLVTGALVVGQGRFAPGLLLEIRGLDASDPKQRSRLIEEIWPIVEQANRHAPGHGRLSKELIILTTPDKLFLRTPKLSIRRKPTIDLYADEIARMYDRYEESIERTHHDLPPSADLSTVGHVKAFISMCIASETGWDHQPHANEDFFSLGMDSLHVVRIARAIKAALAEQGLPQAFDVRTLYQNPSIESLSQTVYERIHSEGGVNVEQSVDQVSGIDALVEEYSHFENISCEVQESPHGTEAGREMNVILTGSTGSLGGYLLLSLLAKPEVRRIYCLNRSKDAKERQIRQLLEQGIAPSQVDELDFRVRFLHTTSLDAPQLGLADRNDYDMLRNGAVSHIIHNAWPVNFNLSLSSFISQVAGVRALIDFCAAMPAPPKFLFVSSLSSVTALSGKQVVPESVVLDGTAPSPMGYGQSKHVAERVLNAATEASRGAVLTAILRVGQIAGPVKSGKASWPAREWFPSLAISSRTVRALPTSLGRMDDVDWIPVDLLADAVVEILINRQVWTQTEVKDVPARSAVFHVINPNAVAWAELLPSLQVQAGVEQTVSLKQWIELVRNGPPEDSSTHPNPAKKILQFYEGLAEATVGTCDTTGLHSNGSRFELGRMARYSDTFKSMQPVSGEWLTRWSSHWF